MSWGEFTSLVFFLLAGYALLWFGFSARRRWVRVVLSLAATIYLLLYSSMLLLAGSADDIQGTAIDTAVFVMAIVCGLGAMAAVVSLCMSGRRRTSQ